jgi:integrase
LIGFPPLEPAEARRLLDSISTTTPAVLRDRALIGLMVYTFVRIGAALAMKVEDVYTERRRLWVRPPGGVEVRLAAGGCCRIRRGTAFHNSIKQP